MKVAAIGLDIAKHIFQVHGADAEGRPLLQRRLRWLVAVGCVCPFLRPLAAASMAGLRHKVRHKFSGREFGLRARE
jgi:hypothetical protein